MRRIAVGFVVLMVAGALLFFVPQISSQSRDNRDDRPRRDRGGQRRGDPREAGRGAFVPPPPPVLSALDADEDGEISPEELSNATAALKSLDKNNDGELAGAELIPDFGGGGFPFPGGDFPSGRGGGGPGGFGGPPPGGRGGFNPFGRGDANVERRAPDEIEFRDGVATIPDHATFHELSYRGEESNRWPENS